MRTEKILVRRIERQILLIRRHKVMLDSDLAELYGVDVGHLNEAVRRHPKRFPRDFMFQLAQEEFKSLKSQIAISSFGWGGRRHAPYAFTEQGIAMLSSVLNSERAIQVNVAIMRAFVKLRRMLSTNRKLAQKLMELEHRLEGHDHQIRSIFDAIRELMAPPPAPRRRMGFHVG